MNAAEYLLQNGVREDELALLTLSGDYTYAQLRHALEQVAQFLVRAGAQKGDRIMLMAKNSLFWVAAYLGSMRAGCTCVPLAVSSEKAELDYILQSTSPRFVFVAESGATQVVSSLPSKAVVVLDDGAHQLADGRFF